MRATLLIDERQILSEAAFIEIVVWRVPNVVRGSTHSLKYSLAYIVEGSCVLRYDNEAGKGDHKHVNGIESRYAFTTAEALLANFFADVDAWRPE